MNPSSGKVLAIDLGKKRVGLAISNQAKTIAFPLKTIETGKSLEQTSLLLLEEMKRLGDIETILLGLPLHLSGEESSMSIYVKKFHTYFMTKTTIPILLVDERLSSKGAERHLIDQKMKRKDRKQVIDPLSAHFILQTYLDKIQKNS